MKRFPDNRGGYNRNKINHDFFTTWSPTMAYVLGYAFADGTLIDSAPSRTCYLRFHSVDLDLLEQINNVLDHHGKIFHREPQIIKKGAKQYTSKICYYISIGSRKLFSDVTKLGLAPRKSLDIAFPYVPEDHLCYFIRGYFDGDGCVNIRHDNKRLHVVFTSGSKVFLSALSERLAGALPVGKKNVVNSTRSYQLRYSTREAVKILAFLYEDLLKCPYLERKYAVYKKWRGTQMA